MFFGILPVYEIIHGPTVKEGDSPAFLAISLVFDCTGE